ncbi:putative serine/threonine-protein kinase At1g54610 isoform X2 [Silene latifolia]|uniref:putative serine/threonine-protein kinase At1g54610 isoform X2 n=1 Tax=Silene latifolia TaxID=37657 RepID=UPI003D77777E
MGCVFGKEGLALEGREKKSKGDLGAESGRKAELPEVGVVSSLGEGKEGENGASELSDGGKKEDEEEDRKGGENGEEGGEDEEVKVEKSQKSRGERKRSKANPRLSNPPKNIHGEQVAAGWPSWLSAVAGEAINGWVPRRADTFEKIDKIGQGTYSNVYKAKDSLSGKIVALKKVRFDNLEPESVKFMAREILIIRRLNHPNVVKLEGLVTSRMSCSLYLVFEYMEHDLAGLAASPDIKFTEPQVKCYMNQLISGLEHCHNRGVLHRDIKGSNLLLDNGGILKIADFGLATFFDPNKKHPMTSRVVTLWYRAPELLLGATDYGVGIDLWSAGCILAELLAGRPIMPGRTEVEQLHKIYKLCGSPSDEYWKKSKLPNATIFRPRDPYKRSIRETFKDFPPSALSLIDTLLAIDPAERLTATDALNSDFFNTEPLACDPSTLPKYPPSKEMDAKRRDDEARRLRAANKQQGDGAKKTRTRDRLRAKPAPEANAELQVNLDRRRMITQANAKSKSEKFPPPHQDGGLGYPLGVSQHIDPANIPTDIPYSTTSFTYAKGPGQHWSGPLVDPASAGGPRRKKKNVVEGSEPKSTGRRDTSSSSKTRGK